MLRYALGVVVVLFVGSTALAAPPNAPSAVIATPNFSGDWGLVQVDAGPAPSGDGAIYEFREYIGGAWGAWNGGGSTSGFGAGNEGTIFQSKVYEGGEGFQVRAKSYHGSPQEESDWVYGDEEIIPLPPPPDAPTGLTAAAASSTSILLAWSDESDDETGFEIWRREGEGSWGLIHTTAANVESYLDTGLDPETQYEYQVRAVNDDLESDFTSSATATTTAPPPEALSHVSGTITFDDVYAVEVGYVRLVEIGAFGSGGLELSSPKGLYSCGSRSFKIHVMYTWVHPQNPTTRSAQTGTYTFNVGRNGYISVTGSPTNGNNEYAFHPKMLAFLIDNWQDLPPNYVTYPGWFSPWPAFDGPAGPHWSVPSTNRSGTLEEMLATDAGAAHAQEVYRQVQLLYSSIVNNDVDWTQEIPRCPGENLDAWDATPNTVGGSGGSSGLNGNYTRQDGDSVAPSPGDILGENIPADLDGLRNAIPEVDFDQEVSTSYTLSWAGLFPGWSAGNATWEIDIAKFGNNDAIEEGVSPWRTWLRGLLLSFVYSACCWRAFAIIKGLF